MPHLDGCLGPLWGSPEDVIPPVPRLAPPPFPNWLLCLPSLFSISFPIWRFFSVSQGASPGPGPGNHRSTGCSYRHCSFVEDGDQRTSLPTVPGEREGPRAWGGLREELGKSGPVWGSVICGFPLQAQVGRLPSAGTGLRLPPVAMRSNAGARSAFWKRS